MRIVTLIRKPLEGTTTESSLEHGTGALNIEGSRVGEVRRWPSNLFVSEASAAKMDDQSGYLKTGKVASHSEKGMWGSGADIDYADVEEGGGASRFFKKVGA